MAPAGAAYQYYELRAGVQTGLHGADDVGLDVHYGREAGYHHFRVQPDEALHDFGGVEVQHGTVFDLVTGGDYKGSVYHGRLHLSLAQ